MNKLVAGQQGFMLLEVILSLMVISVSLVVIVSSLMGSCHAQAVNEDYFTALNLLENRMVNLQLSGEIKDDSEIINQHGVEYALTTEIINNDADNAGFKELRLTVEWKRGHKKNNAAIETQIQSKG